MFGRQTWAALAAVGAMAAVAASSAAGDAPGELKKGDRIVFLGDSITQGGGGPTGYVTLIEKALAGAHKDLGIEVVNAGISGNKVADLRGRIDRDVIAKQPTVVVIYIGINDVWHGEHDPARGTAAGAFEAGLRELIGKCKAAGARVVLCTPSVIGEKRAGANALDAKLDAYAGITRWVAKEEKVGLCDLRKAFLDHEAAHNPEDKEAGILTGDRVHLNDAGNKLVAGAMLEALGEGCDCAK